MSKIILSKNFIRSVCKLALNEDLYPSGDITSSLLNDNIKKKLKLITNQNGIIGGLEFAKQTFKLIDNKIKFDIKKKEGSAIKKGNVIATIDPFFIKDPSFFFVINFILLSNKLKVCFANANPPIIPFWLLINLIFFLEFLPNKFDVISPDG